MFGSRYIGFSSYETHSDEYSLNSLNEYFFFCVKTKTEKEKKRKRRKKKKEKKKKENSVKSDKEFISGMGVTRNLSITVSAETRTAQDKPLPKSDLIDGLLDLAFDFFNSAAKHDDRSS